MEDDSKIVQFEDGNGGRLELILSREGDRYATTVKLNGVLCHLEAMLASHLTSDYMVDDDPDYLPQVDEDGNAYLLLPFTR